VVLREYEENFALFRRDPGHPVLYATHIRLAGEKKLLEQHAELAAPDDPRHAGSSELRVETDQRDPVTLVDHEFVFSDGRVMDPAIATQMETAYGGEFLMRGQRVIDAELQVTDKVYSREELWDDLGRTHDDDARVSFLLKHKEALQHLEGKWKGSDAQWVRVVKEARIWNPRVAKWLVDAYMSGTL
jgi:hypothetical protein